MSKPTRKTAPIKKPRPDFPLFPHATNRWAKKIHGKMHYFGKVSTDTKGEQALAKWLNQKDELLAGRTPAAHDGEGATVEDLANHFLNNKRMLLTASEIVDRYFAQCYATCERLISVFGGKTPIDALLADDFARLRVNISKTWGPVALGNEIQRVRSVFKYGFEAGLTDKPPRFGPGFKKPSAKVLRQTRAKRGLRMFERDELIAVLNASSAIGKAMILLAINAGLGNGDIGSLTTSAINFKTAWLTFPRPKTGIERRIPLWPETIAALKAYRAMRPNPADPADKPLLFIGKHGEPILTPNGFRVGQEFKRSISAAGKDRAGLSFYALRHTFQTVAEGARDLAAVQAIMGHAPSSSDMSATYRERIDDDRLRAVTDFVHAWLFGPNNSHAAK